MKVQIFDAPKGDETVILLRLIPYDGGVALVQVEPSGQTKNYLLNVTKTGHLRRYGAIDPDSGLPLDRAGKIALSE